MAKQQGLPRQNIVKEKKLRELASLYRSALRKISTIILETDNFSRAQRILIVQNVQGILAQLGNELGAWADEEMPAYYRDGIKSAEAQLRRLGVQVDRLDDFTVIDRDAVAAIVDEVKLGFAESMRGVGRSVQGVLSEAARLEINALLGEGIISGEATRQIAKEVKGLLQERGLTALVDKSGRRWELDRYTNMLVRTKAVEARNVGLGNRMAQHDFDLVQVSTHGSDHAECGFWEGKILSYTGRTPVGTKLPNGAIVAGTYQQAKDAGLFHPNCEHSINAITPELARETQVYQNPTLTE